ncbi:Armadillo repeat-containing protein 4 [Phlyctochytrium planicorne]|nr:Armadillo repeat-containing protein 4 [Phlyctochytrium planicorne]
MGATLSSLLQWGADASSDKAPGSSLQTSVSNQNLLHELVHIIEALALQHPVEAKAEFKRPLQWQSTSLRPSHFSALSNASSMWTIVPFGQKNHKAMVSSIATKSDGQPFFILEQVTAAGSDAGAVFVAKVSSVEYLHRALQVAEDMKLRELQDILQANTSPINAIFGTSGTSTSTILLEAFDACNNETEAKRRDQNLKLYKLLLVMNSFDLDLLASAVKAQQREKFLDIHKVSTELQMLQSFCGKDQKCALLSIDWESDFIFSNGCRAPPWRQVYGEISYIEVQCMDVDRFIVTATKSGYFINKGYSADDKGNERLNYEKISDAFPTLIDLIKSQSKHFDSRIDKQDYLYQPIESLEISALANTSPQADNSGVGESKDEDSSEGDLEDESNGNNQSRIRDAKRSTTKKKSKSSPKNRNVTEPSLKWRSLGMTLEEAKNQKKKRYGRPGSEKGRAANGNGGRQESPARGRKLGGSVRSPSLDGEDVSDSDADELPAEYYSIQKLVKYLRCGNQTATIIAICSLRDFDLTNEFNQIAIRDVGGLDTLVNLLDTDNPKCKNGALKILKEISQNVQIRSSIADLDGMQPLVELLRDPDEEIKCLAAETISHCAKNARNRRAVRRYGGIRKLVRLLKNKSVTKEERVAISGALALATCSKSAKNKEAIQLAGAIPLLANLLESQNESLLIPVVGILQECASDENYRVAIRSSGMIRFLVENLGSKNEELQTHCASAIFKCAEEDETRALVRMYNGLTPLVNLLDNLSNKELLVAATGAVWKCAQNLDNVAAFNKLNTIKKLVGLMENQPEDVLVNVVGALGACAQTPDGRQSIRESNGITPLVNLLTGTNQALLVNVTTAVGACALDSDSMAIIDRLDGVRLLWSLLKSANPQVQASAAWAISPCIEHAKDAGEMVRSFVGGLELIVSLLKSDNSEVLASVCAAIANIAKDEENLAVITDHGVVPMLAKLTNTRNDKLRKHLAEAIARCCHWGNNRVAFGTASAVAPLVKYLRSPDEEVHRSTARALHQLSMDPDNCITMHEHGVVQLLLGMVGSSDPALQEAAAGTIGNIRRLALASEKASMS